MKFKVTDKVEDWSCNLKLKFMVWSLKLKFEIEVWIWEMKLEFEVENKNQKIWQSKYEVGI